MNDFTKQELEILIENLIIDRNVRNIINAIRVFEFCKSEEIMKRFDDIVCTSGIREEVYEYSNFKHACIKQYIQEFMNLGSREELDKLNVQNVKDCDKTGINQTVQNKFLMLISELTSIDARSDDR